MKKNLVMLVIILIVLSSCPITTLGNIKCADFLTLNLGESKEITIEKLKSLQDQGDIKPVSESEDKYRTVFLTEEATFTTAFYKEQLYSIIFTFENQFTEAEYPDKLKEFILTKIQPRLNKLYGSTVEENQFPDPKYFTSNKSIWLSRWVTTNSLIYSEISKSENLYLVSVSMYDKELYWDRWAEIRKKMKEQEQEVKTLQKQIEELNTKPSN